MTPSDRPGLVPVSIGERANAPRLSDPSTMGKEERIANSDTGAITCSQAVKFQRTI